MHWLELIIHSTSTFGVSNSMLSISISNEKMLSIFDLDMNIQSNC